MATTGIYEVVDTWGDGGTVFTSIKMTITDTAYAAGSRMIDITSTVAGGYFRADVDGNFALSGHIDFNPIAAPAWAEGRTFYDEDEKALSYYNEEADVTINIGQESVLRVQNNSGGDIDDGEAVYISGAAGGLPLINKAIATTGSSQVVGVVTHSIEDGTIGYVTTFGIVRGLDTAGEGWSAGDVLYLSDTVAGEITNAEPTYPLRVVQIGVCITSSASGKIFVDIDQNSAVLAVIKSYNFSARNAASGEYYQAGFYEAPAADADLDEGSLTQTLGVTNIIHAAHAFIVSAGDGVTDGSDLVLTVSGTSITDAGVRTPTDSEVVVADALAGACPVNTYLETVKKWLGQITYTLSSTAGATFAFTFNYGFAKYEDFNNVDVTLRGLECVGLADATDTGFNIQLYHHNATGHTYSAAAFVAGNTPILDMNVVHGTEQNIAAGDGFAFKRTELAVAISGAAQEGLVIKITTSVNNSVAYLNSHLTATAP